MILFVTNIGLPFIKGQLEFIKPLSDQVLSIIETPDYSEELGSRENVKNSFSDLIKIWINKDKERILLFIDEQDRCSDKTVVDYLTLCNSFY